MYRIPRLLAGLTAALAVIGLGVWPTATPAPDTIRPFAGVLEPPRPLSVAPTTTLPPPPADARCPQWWGLAREVGFTDDQLPTLDYLMWRESRCDPTQHNTTRNKDGSTDVGLTQINDWSWCLPTRWYPNGYLQTIGVLTTVGCEQLFDPATNLKAALAIHAYSTETTGNGWQPWQL